MSKRKRISNPKPLKLSGYKPEKATTLNNN
jgi:hypothetical protein